MEKDTKAFVIQVRVEPALKDALQKLADMDNRTLSNFVYMQLKKLTEKTSKKGS